MTQFFSVENLQSFLEKNPDSLAFAHLAARLIDEGEYQKAVEVCNKGLAKNPHYSFGHFILGTAHYHIKNYTDAKKELEKALAYDPNNPRAWEILSAINDILNLNDDSRESNLHLYLIDSLKGDASSNYLPTQESPSFELSETKSSADEVTRIDEGAQAADTETEGEENLEQIMDNVVESGEQEYDFEKALNEVFRNKEAESAPESDAEKEEEIADFSGPEEKSEVEEEKVSADEFTSAIESFFEESQEKESDTLSSEEEQSIEQSEMEEISETGTEDQTIYQELSPEQEEVKEESDKSPEETEELTIGEEKAEKTPDDEFLDFTTFVSDVIKDTDDKSEDKKEIGFEELALPEDEQKPEMITGEPEETGEPKSSLPESETDIPVEADFDAEILPKEEEKPVAEPDESVPEMDIPEESVPQKIKTKFEKPPILSPTLGEIYIAQGRFEEAIDVFNQLLDKDPENTRFKRKIDDLQKIMLKKKSGSE
jgi:tetratricopeptide (TPR) repeat protein